ncbi:MAG TPA: 30S ribosomal protein S9 [Myxococcota bacterium]|nr:30S ribosomal protein S9 [Myxococcota bacterium]HNZ02679.1 30S ribosomal protein S9 [Myxococcota bacterium]HOD06706.1 30S ribosomal protein S9 [Myxococcota bacterium]HPB50032.1 30S ribosomal protein S9 [Myxococcota bacterium]HQP94596.1 30S ribosomal protein S9 [Myxococcota bacterium]
MAEASVMWATGRRKEAAARVRVVPGTGKIVVNGRDLDNYFCRPNHRILVRTPFVVLGNGDQFDVLCTVRGGGETGQAGAIRHGIARALAAMNVEEWRTPVKKAGFLTRDPRAKERKKYGRPGARKRFQYSKR